MVSKIWEGEQFHTKARFYGLLYLIRSLIVSSKFHDFLFIVMQRAWSGPKLWFASIIARTRQTKFRNKFVLDRNGFRSLRGSTLPFYAGRVFGRLDGGVDQGAFVGPRLHTISMTLRADTTRIAGQPNRQSQPMQLLRPIHNMSPRQAVSMKYRSS
jgi:hypothetical protein